LIVVGYLERLTGWRRIISGFQSYCPLELPGEIKKTNKRTKDGAFSPGQVS